MRVGDEGQKQQSTVLNAVVVNLSGVLNARLDFIHQDNPEPANISIQRKEYIVSDVEDWQC